MPTGVEHKKPVTSEMAITPAPASDADRR